MFFLKMSQGKFIFKRLLMENGIYKSWLKPGTTAYTSKCSVFVSEFNVAWGCESAVKSHEHVSTHTRNMTDLKSAKKSLAPLFFRKTPVHSNASSSSASGTFEKLATSSPSGQSTAIDEPVSQQASVTRAEIKCVLRLVKNHYSVRSCLVFLNNDIVSNFKLSKTKCAYLVTHGFAPWVKINLQVELSNYPFTVSHLMSD